MIQIAIIGLGRIGASLGLALRRNKGANYEVIGHDREPRVSGYAEKTGAVARIEWNLPRLCEAADVLVLALPLSEMRATLALVGPLTKPHSVTLDTAPLKAPVLAWAEELLPPDRYFVGGHPLLNPVFLHDGNLGPEAARADLFEHSLFALLPARNAPPEALKLGHDLARFVGASPFFMDAAEHDGLMAAVDATPALLAAALLLAVTESSGWNEMRRVADRTFATATAAASLRLPAALSSALTLNRANVLRTLDAASAQLASLREAVASGDEGTLEASLSEAAERRERWLRERREGNWEAEGSPAMELPAPGEMLGQSLGLGGLIHRRAEEKRKGAVEPIPRQSKGKM